MKPGVDYNLYRYDRLTSIPNRGFNAHAGDAKQRWAITAGASGRFVLTETVMSDEVAAYRAVPTKAP
jgi:hypothetical protein